MLTPLNIYKVDNAHAQRASLTIYRTSITNPYGKFKHRNELIANKCKKNKKGGGGRFKSRICHLGT